MTELMLNAKESLMNMVVNEMDFTKDISDEELLKIIDEVFSGLDIRNRFTISEKLEIRTEVFNALRRMDILQEFLDNDDITEIMINGKDNIFIEERGTLRKVNKQFKSTRKLEDVIQQIVATCNRQVNEAAPIQDARLLTGERVNIVLPPIALNGPVVTIRRFPKKPITMERLIELDSITEEAAEFLKKLVISKYNIFISGGTGSGKTTFLNALSQFIPEDERIITIEDSAELQIQGIDNLVRLETRGKNSEGVKEITIRDLIRTSLRMRPERIIVGECRGEETIDMLSAMNTGHDGSLSTGHANSTADMLTRLETMVLSGMEIPLPAIRAQIASAIDVIIHLGKTREKERKVLEISEITGYENGVISLNTLYEFNGKCLEKKGKMINKEKLVKAGFAL